MISNLLFKNPYKNRLRIGYYAFAIGLFFLASAPFISAIFLLVALVFGSVKRKDKISEDYWNIPFISSSFLMILSCFVNISQASYQNYQYNSYLSFIGLFNWLPFFWCFWGFQPYLISKELRRNCLLLLISGSIPVILTGLGQFFLGWYGPFEIFGGLIIWYQRPIDTSVQGLTALFNNQNYAGSWLSLTFCFSLAFVLANQKDKLKKFSSLILCIFLFISTLLTYSRNAFLSLIITLIIFFKKNKFFIYFFLSFLVGTIILFTNFKLLEIISDYFSQFLPIGLSNKINISIIEDLKLSPRFLIWSKAISFISERSLFGWGAGSFTKLFQDYDYTNIDAQHTHNLPIELALNYGLPVSLIISTTFLLMLYKITNIQKKFKYSSKFKEENIYDISWNTASIIFLFSHLLDITYFDARISIIIWILLAGQRNMLKENKNELILD